MQQLTTAAMKARLNRLDDLAKGLSSEVARRRVRQGPLAYQEQRAYLGALQDAIQGFEAARATLAAAVVRIEATDLLKPAAQR